MNFATILTPVLMLAAMILFGFIAEKTGYVKNINEKVSMVILRMTLPCLLLSSINEKEIDSMRLRGIGFSILLAFISVLLLLGIAFLTGKLEKMEKATYRTHVAAGAFGNVAFIGYPVIRAFLGEGDAFLYAVFYGVTNDVLLYTFGIWFLSGKSNVKKLLNPNTICILLGLVLMLLGLKLPTPVLNTLSTVGAATTPLSMLFIGSVLAGLPLKGFFKSRTIWMNIIVKMLVLPILVFLALRGRVAEAVLSAVVMQIAMPCQTTLTIVSGECGGDRAYAARSVALTTIVCILSLPLVFYLMTNVL